MAKKVDVTFKNPIDESFIDHMELWRKTGIGGSFAQLGADIPFVTGTANYTYEDLTADADLETYYYEARAYNDNGGDVLGVDYNQISANITISGGILYGISFVSSADSIKRLGNLTIGNTFDFEMKIVNGVTGGYMMGNDKTGSVAGAVALRYDLNTYKLQLGDGTDNNETLIKSGVTGNELIGITRDANNFYAYVDGILELTKPIPVGWIETLSVFVVGSSKDNGSQGMTATLESFSLNGEFYPCEENTGTLTQGDLGTVFNFIGAPSWVTL